jgi:hypothetical protein
MQGHLKIWTEHSTLIFENLKPVVLIFKIRRVRLKNLTCHGHFSFDVYVAINPSILQLESSPFGFK